MKHALINWHAGDRIRLGEPFLHYDVHAQAICWNSLVLGSYQAALFVFGDGGAHTFTPADILDLRITHAGTAVNPDLWYSSTGFALSWGAVSPTVLQELVAATNEGSPQIYRPLDASAVSRFLAGDVIELCHPVVRERRIRALCLDTENASGPGLPLFMLANRNVHVFSNENLDELGARFIRHLPHVERYRWSNLAQIWTDGIGGTFGDIRQETGTTI